MVWGCFVGDKLGPLVCINDKIKQDVYIQLLDENLLSFIDVLHANGISELIFQQDNARPHTAQKTKDWLKVVGEKHSFTIIEWPANSSDLNPIENLWAYVKAELHRRYPDTKYLQGSPETIRKVLKPRVTEIWWEIGEEVLNGLIDSMPHRVEAVLHAKGWYTKYWM